VGALVVGVALGWQVKPHPKLEPKVTVPDSAIARSVPTPPKGIERVVRTTMRPTQVATSEGRPGAAAVLDYCRPSLTVDGVAPEFGSVGGAARPLPVPVTNAVPVDTARPVLPPFSGKFHAKHLELHSVLSDGRLYRATYARLRDGSEWGSDADSTWLSQPRLWVRVGQGATQCVKQSPVGAVLGLVIGAALRKPEIGAAAGAGVACADGFIDKVP
jgi:hypothetical protein